jgi:hypothetical protein
MLSDLLNIVESDRTAAEFYLLSDTESLYRWIAGIPAVSVLESLMAADLVNAELVATRSLELFQAPVTPGYRSEFEPSICCYSYVLSRSLNENARWVLSQLDTQCGPEHGWLRRLLNRCLQNESTSESLEETYMPTRPGSVSLVTTTLSTTVQPALTATNDTSFDFLMEFWSSDDYVDLKAAA